MSNPYEVSLPLFAGRHALSLADLRAAFPELIVRSRDFSNDEYAGFLRTALPNHIEISNFTFHKKKLELFISHSLLNIDADTVLLDAAGGGYSYAGQASLKRGYLQDLEIRPAVRKRVGPHVGYLESDVGAIPLPDASVDAICCHHAFEHFQGGADIAFLQEVQRLLSPRGAAVIVPLFICRSAVEITNLETFDNWTLPEAQRLFDPVATLPGTKSGNFARVYDPDLFRQRVLGAIDPAGFQVEIVEVTREGEPVPNPAHYLPGDVSNFNFPYRALRLSRR